MVEYKQRPTEERDIPELLENMREPDKEALMASHGFSPEQGVEHALSVSRDAITGLADGKLVCVYGSQRLTVLGTIGLPWMFSTNELPKHYRAFARKSLRGLEAWRAEYSLLYVMVDRRNTAAWRWISWLGFILAGTQEVGEDKILFDEFVMGVEL